MKRICVKLQEESIKIIPIGDVHRGSSQFNEKLFIDVINTIKNNDNYYTMLMGDLIDNALKNSKSNIYEAVESPSKSIDWLIEKLEPIKHKILTIIPGNHEERTFKEAGIDPLEKLVEKLGLRERYSKEPFILFLTLKDGNVFTIYGAHGASSGTTMGTIANKITSLGNILVNADIYVMGHSHKPMIAFEPCFVVNEVRRTYKLLERLYVNCASFVNYEGGYGEQKLYKPTSYVIPVICLEVKSKKTKIISAETLK